MMNHHGSPVRHVQASQGSFRAFKKVLPLGVVILMTIWQFLQGFQAPGWDGSSSLRASCEDMDDENVATTYQLAFEQSFGFFSDVSNTDWETFYRQPARQAQHYQNPRNWNRDHDASYWNFHNWDPYFNCPHVRKVGGLGGAAKWTCDLERIQQVATRRARQAPDPTSPSCLIYSIGSRGNFQFEEDLVKHLGPDVCEIHIFDPEDYAPPPKSSSENAFSKAVRYHKVGLKSSYSLDYRKDAREPHLTFAEIQLTLGHVNRPIDIFKIDCEGCEWHTYKDWVGADIGQILMETHEIPWADQERKTDFGWLPAMPASDMFDELKAHGFALFSKEVNSQKGTGRSVEWSLLRLRRDFFEEIPVDAI